MNPRYQNKKLYSECQLVSALNASYKLGFPQIKMGCGEYERLVDFTRGRYGSCLSIKPIYEYLKIEYFDIDPVWDNIELMLNQGFPVTLSISSSSTGLHSVCVVDSKYDYFKVPNIPKLTDRNMWIREKYLKEIVLNMPNVAPHGKNYRVFLKHRLHKDT